MQELVMFVCALEVLACVATGPAALAYFARRRARRDWPAAKVNDPPAWLPA